VLINHIFLNRINTGPKKLWREYILHFRHAERDKWIDVAMYVSLENNVHNNGINYNRYAENDYFDEEVCLNNRRKFK
jgi:hypothetical protein